MTVGQLMEKLKVFDLSMEIKVYDGYKREAHFLEIREAASHFIPQNGDEPEEIKFVLISI